MYSGPSVKDDESDSDLVYALKERIRQLESLLGAEWRAPRCLGLTPTEERVLGLIATNGEVSRRRIYDTLYGTRPDPPGDRIIPVFVTHMRHKLRPYGIEIMTLWNRGYYLDEPGRLDALYGPDEHHSPIET